MANMFCFGTDLGETGFFLVYENQKVISGRLLKDVEVVGHIMSLKLKV